MCLHTHTEASAASTGLPKAMHISLQHVSHYSGMHLVPGLGESVATLAFLLPLPEYAHQGVIWAIAVCLITEQGSCGVCHTSIAPKTVA